MCTNETETVTCLSPLGVVQRLVVGGGQWGCLLAARPSGPDYQPAQFVVRASWHGARPLVEAKPSDAELHPDWWTLYDDPILDRLEEQAMAATPEAQEPSGKYGCIGHR